MVFWKQYASVLQVIPQGKPFLWCVNMQERFVCMLERFLKTFMNKMTHFVDVTALFTFVCLRDWAVTNLKQPKLKSKFLHCRWTYAEFFQRYRVLATFKLIVKNNMRKTCEAILPTLIAVSYFFGRIILYEVCFKECTIEDYFAS